MIFSPDKTDSDSSSFRPSGSDEGWRGRGESTGSSPHGGGWRERGGVRGDYKREYKNRERLWERGGQHFSPHFYLSYSDGGPQNRTEQSRGRSYRNRGRYQLAPR